jgi:hypothetical protein
MPAVIETECLCLRRKEPDMKPQKNARTTLRSIRCLYSKEERSTYMRSIYLLGSIALAAASLHGQTYYAPTPPDCSSIGGESPAKITNSAGATLGYSCWIGGTFADYAAGGGWSSAIRVAAPATGAIQVNYWFYDANGNDLSLDTGGAVTGSNTSEVFALNANQPSEIDIAGASSTAPNYGSTASGSVYAEFFCPDATTCLNVQPQLLYSSTSQPWIITVPISWDLYSISTQWSFVGEDNGGSQQISLVIYNEGSSTDFTNSSSTTFTVYVYNNAGALVGTGTTPAIPPTYQARDGSVYEGGSYSVILDQIPGMPTLPSGPLKVLIDGGDQDSAVQAVQIANGSATALQIGFDNSPNSAAIAFQPAICKGPGACPDVAASHHRASRFRPPVIPRTVQK